MNLRAHLAYFFWDIICDHHKAKAHQASKDAFYHQEMWRNATNFRNEAFNRIFGVKDGGK